jgi:sulfide:quinone oxidoreductase
MHSSDHQTRVLIVGGGVAALEGALGLSQLAAGLVHTTLLAPGDEFVYRPVSVGEPFGHEVARSYPLRRIVADLDIEHDRDSLKWVDPHERVVHTEQGRALEYDALLLALGARLYSSFEHSLTLDPGKLDEQLHGLIQDLELGLVHSVVFIIPELTCWPLPIYELALMTASRAYEMNIDAQITVITPEEAPLAIFGSNASQAVSRRLEQRGVTTLTSSRCVVREPGHVMVFPEERQITADQVVTLPALHGPAVPGIPRSASHGFISVDRHSRVEALERVFAAGDMTDFPIKLGGIAAQQADAAVESIAALAGAEIEPQPFVGWVHGMLVGGGHPLYMQAQVAGSLGTASEVSDQPLWTPGTKIYARYLGPYLKSLDVALAPG